MSHADRQRILAGDGRGAGARDLHGWTEDKSVDRMGRAAVAQTRCCDPQPAEYFSGHGRLSSSTIALVLAAEIDF